MVKSDGEKQMVGKVTIWKNDISISECEFYFCNQKKIAIKNNLYT